MHGIQKDDISGSAESIMINVLSYEPDNIIGVEC